MQREQTDLITDDDVAASIAFLESTPFGPTPVGDACHADDPEWHTDEGVPIADHVFERGQEFMRDAESFALSGLDSTMLRRSKDGLHLVLAGNHWSDFLTRPEPRDLLHVYGPDVDGTNDWRCFYRLAWTQLDPPTGHGTIYSSDDDIRRKGVLSASTFAYSGQSSSAIVGTGIYFRPFYGDSFIDVRPYLRWATRASFTGTSDATASVSGFVGIFIESWDHATGGGRQVERDVFVPVYAQTTGGKAVGIESNGAVSVGDGLTTTGLLAVTQRRYGIYVYAWLQASAATGGDGLRFARIDIDATVPYVVVQETPI